MQCERENESKSQRTPILFLSKLLSSLYPWLMSRGINYKLPFLSSPVSQVPSQVPLLQTESAGQGHAMGPHSKSGAQGQQTSVRAALSPGGDPVRSDQVHVSVEASEDYTALTIAVLCFPVQYCAPCITLYCVLLYTSIACLHCGTRHSNLHNSKETI